MKLGPLPVQVAVDTDTAELHLEHGGHEVAQALDYPKPLELLLRPGLILVASRPATAAPPAPAKDRLEAALHPTEEIPESGEAMRARIAAAKKVGAGNGVAPRSALMDKFREKDAAARRKARA